MLHLHLTKSIGISYLTNILKFTIIFIRKLQEQLL